MSTRFYTGQKDYVIQLNEMDDVLALIAAGSFEGTTVTADGFIGTATNANNIAITDDTATNASVYLTWVGGASGNQAEKVSSTKLTFNPSTGILSAVGLSTSGNATVGGNLTVTGNLTINGTTTTVNSTTVTVDDPIITLGGDTAPTVDDNKDRGVEFRWHNGSTAKVGFFGFDRSTQKLTFIPDATNTSEVFTGTAGTIVANLEGNASNITGNLAANQGGVPTGGTTGQVLKKNSNSDYDASWQVDAGGMTNPMTAAGDIIIGGTSGTPQRLAKGTDGQVLTVVSGNPAWAAATGGGSGTFTASGTAPSSPTAGDRWLDTTTGRQYTYFSDGDSSQWVETGNVINGSQAGQGNLVQEVVITSAATSYTFGGLDSSVDGWYELEIELTGAVAADIQIGINGNTTTTNYWTEYNSSSGTTITSGRANNNNALYHGANRDMLGKLYCSKLPSGYFGFSSEFTEGINTTTPYIQKQGGGSTFTISNITSLTLTASATNGIGVGTIMRLYRGKWQSNGGVKTSFRVGRSTSQSISAATYTQVVMDTIAHDMLSETGSDGTFTAKNAGDYVFTMGVVETNATSALRINLLYVNGVEKFRDIPWPPNLSTAVSMQAITTFPVVRLNAGDTVKPYYYTSTANTLYASLSGNYFSGYRVGV
jgi:hypothetical protein